MNLDDALGLMSEDLRPLVLAVAAKAPDCQFAVGDYGHQVLMKIPGGSAELAISLPVREGTFRLDPEDIDGALARLRALNEKGVRRLIVFGWG